MLSRQNWQRIPIKADERSTSTGGRGGGSGGNRGSSRTTQSFPLSQDIVDKKDILNLMLTPKMIYVPSGRGKLGSYTEGETMNSGLAFSPLPMIPYHRLLLT